MTDLSQKRFNVGKVTRRSEEQNLRTSSDLIEIWDEANYFDWMNWLFYFWQQNMCGRLFESNGFILLKDMLIWYNWNSLKTEWMFCNEEKMNVLKSKNIHKKQKHSLRHTRKRDIWFATALSFIFLHFVINLLFEQFNGISFEVGLHNNIHFNVLPLGIGSLWYIFSFSKLTAHKVVAHFTIFHLRIVLYECFEGKIFCWR